MVPGTAVALLSVLPMDRSARGVSVSVSVALLLPGVASAMPAGTVAVAVLLRLPVADGLIVGFFECGAYQETLGGRWGAKHCLLPEAAELVLDEDENGGLTYAYSGGQTADDVLDNLGYVPQHAVAELEQVAL